MTKFHSALKELVRFMLGLSFLTGCPMAAYAKPSLQPLAANIAETGSQFYRFQTRNFWSQDQKRLYKVWLGIPKQRHFAQPQPAFFMLDGNAVMDRLNDSLLKTLAAQDGPVLVAIGYYSNLPFDVNSRSLDYTPADATGKPAPDPRNLDRLSGGSAAFRQVILQEIAPWVEQQVKLDPTKRALWGHSYGGLFVLDTLLHSNYFSHYYAASPSLSWANGRIINQIAQASAILLQSKQLLLIEGDSGVQSGDQVSRNFNPDMILNNRQILQSLHQQGVKARFLLYPGLSHGAVFDVSLHDVLSQQLF